MPRIPAVCCRPEAIRPVISRSRWSRMLSRARRLCAWAPAARRARLSCCGAPVARSWPCAAPTCSWAAWLIPASRKGSRAERVSRARFSSASMGWSWRCSVVRISARAADRSSRCRASSARIARRCLRASVALKAVPKAPIPNCIQGITILKLQCEVE